MNIAILMPTYKTMPSVSFYCYHKMRNDFDNMTDVTYKCFSIDGVYIHKAREKLMHKVMGSGIDFDWIMHIDSDIIFTARDILELIYHAESSKLELLSGLYFSRDTTGERVPPCAYKLNANGTYTSLFKVPQKPIVKVDAVGFGFIAIKPRIYKELIKKHGIVFSGEKQQGEDLEFCEKAKDLVPIKLSTKVIVRHYGSLIDLEQHISWVRKVESKADKKTEDYMELINYKPEGVN